MDQNYRASSVWPLFSLAFWEQSSPPSLSGTSFHLPRTTFLGREPSGISKSSPETVQQEPKSSQGLAQTESPRPAALSCALLYFPVYITAENRPGNGYQLRDAGKQLIQSWKGALVGKSFNGLSPMIIINPMIISPGLELENNAPSNLKWSLIHCLALIPCTMKAELIHWVNASPVTYKLSYFSPKPDRKTATTREKIKYLRTHFACILLWDVH